MSIKNKALNREKLQLLLDRLTEQKKGAYENFFVYFGPRLKSRLLKWGATEVEAEDIAEDCLVEFAQNISSYKSDEQTKPLTEWIYSSAEHKWKTRLQRKSKDLVEALDQLTEIDRAIIRLRVFEGHTAADTALMMNISQDVARQRFSRAIKKLIYVLQNKDVSWQNNDVSKKQLPSEELSGWNSPLAASLAERHSVLVDKKFREGLSADEVKELEHIRTIFEQYDAPFYEPIIKRLSALVTQASKENSQSKLENG